jgi:hypothetical protein
LLLLSLLLLSLLLFSLLPLLLLLLLPPNSHRTLFWISRREAPCSLYQLSPHTAHTPYAVFLRS